MTELTDEQCAAIRATVLDSDESDNFGNALIRAAYKAGQESMRRDPCENCDGTGYKMYSVAGTSTSALTDKTHPFQCPTCAGRGVVAK